MKIEHCFSNGEHQNDEAFLSQKKTIDFYKNKTIFGNIINGKKAIQEHTSRVEKEKIRDL